MKASAEKGQNSEEVIVITCIHLQKGPIKGYWDYSIVVSFFVGVYFALCWGMEPLFSSTSTVLLFFSQHDVPLRYSIKV